MWFQITEGLDDAESLNDYSRLNILLAFVIDSWHVYSRMGGCDYFR